MDILNNIPWDIVISYGVTFLIGLSFIAPFILRVRAVLKEVGELLVEIGDCLDDKKITKDEIAEIVKEAQDIVGAFK
jgi:hypothetical protein